MFNVGGGELLVILLVALIVLGPDKLPDAARKMGNIMSELKRMSQGFQNEIRQAMEEQPPPPTPPADAAPTPQQPMMLDAVATEKTDDEPAPAEEPSANSAEGDTPAA